MAARTPAKAAKTRARQSTAIRTAPGSVAVRVAVARTIQKATALATIPDLLNYWLTGKLVSEYTIATTTQFVDAATRSWATGLLVDLEHALVEAQNRIQQLEAQLRQAQQAAQSQGQKSCAWSVGLPPRRVPRIPFHEW